MRPSEALAAHVEEVRAIIARYPVENPRLFGSVARGEDTEASDVDILVDSKDDLDLFALGGLMIEIEDLIGARVDVVTSGGLREFARQTAMRDARPL